MVKCSVSGWYPGECLWLDLPLIKKVMKGARSLFPEVHYAYTTIPTYPSGQIGFVVASTSEVGVYTVWLIPLLHEHM